MTTEQGGTYDLGDVVRLFGVFKLPTFTVDATTGIVSRTKVLADPTTITLEVTSPAAVMTPYTYAGATVTKLQTGTYYKDLTPNAVGTWTYRYVGTGAVAGAGKKTIVVR